MKDIWEDCVLLQITNLRKAFQGNEVLKGVDITVEKGDVIVILGPSGSGKTTLLRCMNFLEQSDSGTMVFDEEELDLSKVTARKIHQIRQKTGFVFQNYCLFNNKTALQNVTEGLIIGRKMKKEQAIQIGKNALDKVGLSDKYDYYPHQLSGGQQQRVALARALVVEPGVLLFDEPLSNLDAKLRVNMRTEIRKIQQKTGITAIYVTHDQSEAMSLSDNIIVMQKGVVAQMGTPEKIYYEPVNEFVADFIGEANFLDGKLLGRKDGKKLLLRPESVTLGDSGVLPCRVVLSTFMGSYQNYQVMVGDELVKITDFNPRSKKIYHEGDTPYLVFDTENVHVL